MTRVPLQSGRCFRSIHLSWLALLLALGLPLTAQRHRFRYYSHGDGLKDTEVHCLLQDHIGFIWAGTATGLFRYDGARFTDFPVPGSGTIVQALAETPDGTLWVGTNSGLARMRDGKLQMVEAVGWVGIPTQSSLVTDSHGQLLAGTTGGLLVGTPRGADYGFMHVRNPEGVLDSAAYGVHIDPAGTVWFGCGDKLCVVESDRAKAVNDESGVPDGRWDAILTDLRRQSVDPQRAKRDGPIEGRTDTSVSETRGWRRPRWV